MGEQISFRCFIAAIGSLGNGRQRPPSSIEISISNVGGRVGDLLASDVRG
jgi:hypothetical protein